MDLTAMMQRVVRAVTFDVKFYNEAKDDPRLTQEALIVVVIAVALAAIGSLLGGFGALVGALISGIVGYYAWAYITHLVGVNFFKGSGTFPQLQRTLGYAWAPQALGIIGLVPCVGWLGALVGGIWSLACGVVAVRETHGFDTNKAILTAIIGWLVWGLLFLLFSLIF